MKHTIADALDKCIDELRRGQTPEECLASYPDAVSTLSPLLQTAAAVRAAPKAKPDMAAMQTGKAAFMQEAARLRRERQQRPAKPWQRLALVASSTFALPRPRALAWAPALSIVLAAALVLGTATTAIAASRSLPDEPLYSVKLASEQVQMALTSNPVARADLALTNAEKRLDEIATLSNLGRPVDAPSIERLTSESRDALSSIGRIEDDAMRPRLQRYLSIVGQQQTLLERVRGISSIAETISAALAVAQENEKLATTAISDPSVLKETPQRSGRGMIAVPAVPIDTPTPQPTPVPQQANTAVPTATVTKAPPQATATKPPPAPTASATAVPPTPTVVITIIVPPTPLPKISFSGVIEKVTPGEWVVGGKAVAVNAQTRVENAAAALPGARADVVAVNQDGRLLAVSIKVHAAVEQPDVLTVHGVILSMSAGAWSLSGQAVAVNSDTAIVGAPALGLLADASGTRSASGVLTASRITVKGPAPEVQVRGRIERISMQAWVISGQSLVIVQGLSSVSGQAAVGSNATATALRLENGSLVARQITVLTEVVEEEFEGVINRMEGSAWVVNGRRVVRNADTQVDESLGRAVVGQRVRVRGVLQGDGSILASSIRVLAAGGSGREASPTVIVSPTAPLQTATGTAIASPTIGASPIATPTPTETAPTASPTATVGAPLRTATPTQTPRVPLRTATPTPQR